MEQQFKKGDLVFLKKDLVINTFYRGYRFFKEMQFDGSKEISEVYKENSVLFTDRAFFYPFEMLELEESTIQYSSLTLSANHYSLLMEMVYNWSIADSQDNKIITTVEIIPFNGEYISAVINYRIVKVL